ncbi:MAG TPA: hypothetical protein VGE58_07525 [Daejeonella sp.]
MVRLSPSDAIFRGVLNFIDVKTHAQTKVGATLDIYHCDLRFEFEGNPLFYNYRDHTFTYDKSTGYKEITNVFWTALEEEAGPIYFISFTFQITRDTVISTYQVSGTVMGENVNADSKEDLKNWGLN